MKKKYIILISIFVLIIVSAFLYLKYNQAKQKTTTPETFTFGEFLGIGQKTNIEQPQSNNSENPTSTETENKTETKKVSLLKISDKAVAGFEIINIEKKNTEEIDTLKIIPDYEFNNDIKNGTKAGLYGEEIRKLQKELNKCPSTMVSKTRAGSPGKETNEFKDGTSLAVKSFQSLFSLTKTGNLDKETRDILNKEWICPTKKGEVVIQYQPSVRYTERATGYIFQNLLDEKDSMQLTNTMIPTVYESYLLNTDIVFRRLKSDKKTIENFIGKIVTIGDESNIKSEILPEGVTSLSTNNISQEIFYTNKSNNHTTGVLYDSKTGTKKQIFDSSFNEWNSYLSLKGPIITTKPSALVLGYSYLINKENKTLQKIMGDILGLTVKPNNEGDSILYSRAKNNSIELALYNIDKKNNQILGIKTLSEKCVFDSKNIYVYCAVPSNIPPGKYPDDWYMGKTVFSDSIIRYDLNTGSIESLLQQTDGKSFDVEDIKIDTSSKYLIIKNKEDGLLLSINLDIALPQIPNDNATISPEAN